MRILRATRVADVLAASALFDQPARPDWAARFLDSPGRHLLLAYVDEVPAGMVTLGRDDLPHYPAFAGGAR